MFPGWLQIVVIAIVVLLLFGAGKIPRLMRDLGSGINSFKRGLKESAVEDTDGDAKDDPKKIKADAAEQPKAAKAKVKAAKG